MRHSPWLHRFIMLMSSVVICSFRFWPAELSVIIKRLIDLLQAFVIIPFYELIGD